MNKLSNITIQLQDLINKNNLPELTKKINELLILTEIDKKKNKKDIDNGNNNNNNCNKNVVGNFIDTILDIYGNTPLLWASYLGLTNCVNILIEMAHSNVQQINYFGQNALTLATYSGNIDCVKLLLKNWSYIEYTYSCVMPPLCIAAMTGNLSLVKFFINSYHNNQLIDKIRTAHGVDSLMLAREYGHHDVIDFLTKHNQSIRIFNSLKRTNTSQG